jgi:endonuclease-3
MDTLQRRALAVHRRLLAAYGDPQWRQQLTPLDELVSTILSQNTNDANRDRAFHALRQRFPTWEAVRDAHPRSVITAIRPAGLAQQKGPRIQAVLREITSQRGDLDLAFLRSWSPDRVFAWLTGFKGVGPKTASIVMLFSLDMPAFPVDTHVHRVTARLGLLPDGMSAEASHPYLAGLFPPETYYAAHLNLIRLGRETCQARKPDCPHCTLRSLCAFALRRPSAKAERRAA